MILQKVLSIVTPAKAGVQNRFNTLDSGFRRNDTRELKMTFYELVS